MSETCPKCGVGVDYCIPDGRTLYICGSTLSASQLLTESSRCLRNQLLLARAEIDRLKTQAQLNADLAAEYKRVADASTEQAKELTEALSELLRVHSGGSGRSATIREMRLAHIKARSALDAAGGE